MTYYRIKLLLVLLLNLSGTALVSIIGKSRNACNSRMQNCTYVVHKEMTHIYSKSVINLKARFALQKVIEIKGDG